MGNRLCRLDCRKVNVNDDTLVQQTPNVVVDSGQPQVATRVNDGPPPRRQSFDFTNTLHPRDLPERQNETRPYVVKLDPYESSEEDVVVGSSASSIRSDSSQRTDLGVPEPRELPTEVWENIALQLANEALFSGTERPSAETVQALINMRKLNKNFDRRIQPLVEPVKQRVLSHKVTTAADLRRMLPTLATMPEPERINTLAVLLVRTHRGGDGDFQDANASRGGPLVEQAIRRLTPANQSAVVAQALATLRPNNGMIFVLGRSEGEGLLRHLPPEHQVEPLTRALDSIETRLNDNSAYSIQDFCEEREIVRQMANALPPGVGDELKARLMNF